MIGALPPTRPTRPPVREPWLRVLRYQLLSDPHVTGRYGFAIFADNDNDYKCIFESGLEYSSERDAEQAASDAAFVAWKWRSL